MNSPFMKIQMLCSEDLSEGKVLTTSAFKRLFILVYPDLTKEDALMTYVKREYVVCRKKVYLMVGATFLRSI